MLVQRLLACALLLVPCTVFCTTIDFEGLSDGTFLSTQFNGLVFSNAEILTAGISLNELEFPPHSGANVVTDFSAPLTVTFLTPVSSVSGYFTYASPLTLDAYNSSSALIGSVRSAFSNNLALSGDPGSSPNELLTLSSASGISQLIIAGLPSGGSFVLDDLTFTTGAVTPEPETMGLAICFTLAVLTWRLLQVHLNRR